MRSASAASSAASRSSQRSCRASAFAAFASYEAPAYAVTPEKSHGAEPPLPPDPPPPQAVVAPTPRIAKQAESRFILSVVPLLKTKVNICLSLDTVGRVLGPEDW